MSGPSPWSPEGPTGPQQPARGAGLRPIDLGTAFELVVRLYRRDWKVLLAVSALFTVPSFLLLALVQDDVARFAAMDPTRPPQPAEVQAIVARLGEYVLVFIASIILGTLASGALVRASADGYVSGRATLGGAVAAALRRAPALIGATLLMTLVMLLVVLVAAILGAFVVSAGGGMGAFLGLVGFVAIAVAVGVLLVRLSLVSQAIVLERAGPMRGLARSWSTTAGAAWRTFGYLLLASLVAGVLGAALTELFGIGVDAAVGDDRVARFQGRLIVGGLASVPFAPLVPLALTILYFDLRLRREGADPTAPSPRPSGEPPAPWS